MGQSAPQTFSVGQKVGAVLGKPPRQPAVGLAQGMVRYAREQVVGGMVPQAHRRPKGSEEVIARDGGGIQDLFLKTHHMIRWVAVAMGREAPHAVGDQNENRRQVPKQEDFPREDSQGHQDDSGGKVGESGEFLDHARSIFPFTGKGPPVTAARRKGGGQHPKGLAQGPDDIGKGGQHQEPQQEESRDHQHGQGEQGDPVGFGEGEGKIFGVVLGAVNLGFVVFGVDPHVEVGGDGEGEAAKQVPNRVKSPEGPLFQVGQLMNEQDGPVKGEAGHDESR